MKKFIRFFIVLCALCTVARPSEAVEVPALEAQVRELTRQVGQLTVMVQEQQKEIRELKGLRPETPPAPAPSTPFPISPAQGRWNPDIGVIGDVVAKLDSPKADEEGADRVSVREVELVFGSPVDPYSRFDATVSFSDFEEASLEEAYLTRFDLPLDLTARVGRFKPRVGKAIQIHRDSLDTVDQPLVIQRYFGLEGYNKSGVDASRLIDLPWPVAHEITAGVLEGGNGEDGTAFGESRRRPTVYSHLKNYVDFSDMTGLEVGLSHLAGSKDEDANFEVQILAGDVTLIHHFNASQRIKLQGEAFHMNRQDTEYGYEVEDPDTGDISLFNDNLDGNLLGAYALVDVRLHPQWAAGFRYDYVELVDISVDSPGNDDTAYTAYLTFHQSEFARWRVQFSHIDTADGVDDNQVLLQGTFAIGEHKHKLT